MEAHVAAGELEIGVADPYGVHREHRFFMSCNRFGQIDPEVNSVAVAINTLHEYFSEF